MFVKLDSFCIAPGLKISNIALTELYNIVSITLLETPEASVKHYYNFFLYLSMNRSPNVGRVTKNLMRQILSVRTTSSVIITVLVECSVILFRISFNNCTQTIIFINYLIKASFRRQIISFSQEHSYRSKIYQ